MANVFKKLSKTIRSTYMCLKYPFLYPRNRFTGLHYNNWKLHDYHTENYKKCTDALFIHIVNAEDAYLKRSKLSSMHGQFNCYVHNEKITILKDEKPFWSINVSDIPSVMGNYIECGFTDKNNFFVIVEDETKIERRFIIKNYVTNRWLYFKVKFADFLNNYVLQFLHCIPTYTEWDVIERGMPGWNKAFGKHLLKVLKKQLKKDHMLYRWRITDIKEKYGSLRIYCNYASKELFNIIDRYEEISYHTCIECGKPAVYLSDGYILPYCEDCFDKQKYKPYAVIGYNKEWIYK